MRYTLTETTVESGVPVTRLLAEGDKLGDVMDTEAVLDILEDEVIAETKARHAEATARGFHDVILTRVDGGAFGVTGPHVADLKFWDEVEVTDPPTDTGDQDDNDNDDDDTPTVVVSPD